MIRKDLHQDLSALPHLFAVSNEEMEQSIGKFVRVVSPELLRYPAYQKGRYEIVGVQLMWGHDQNGVYRPDMLGYRVLDPDDEHRFGFPCLPTDIEIVA